MKLQKRFNALALGLSAGLLAFHFYSSPAQASNRATYEIVGKAFTVAGPVHDALQEATERTGIPYEIFVAVCGIETECDPDKVNGDTNACGLFQLNPAVETLYQLLHDHGAEYGYAKEAKWVERYTRKHDEDGNPVYGYQPVSQEAKERVADLCLSPRFNALMYGAYLKPKADDFNDWLGTRDATLGEHLLITLLGIYGAKLFVKAAWDDATSDMLVVDFFRQHSKYFPGAASSNNGFVRDDEGRHRSIGTAYAQYQNMELTQVEPNQ